MNNNTQLATASALAAGGLRSPAPNEWRKFYLYPIQFLSVAAAATATGSLQFQNDAPFFTLQIVGSAYTVATPPALVANPSVLVNIIDSGSNFPLTASPVNLDQMSGTAQLPYVLPMPYMFNRNSTVTFQVTNNYNATLSIYIVLGGYKKFTATSGYDASSLASNTGPSAIG